VGCAIVQAISCVDVMLPSILELHQPMWAMPLFRQLVTVPSPQMCRLDPRTFRVTFVVEKWHWDRSPCQYVHPCSILIRLSAMLYDVSSHWLNCYIKLRHVVGHKLCCVLHQNGLKTVCMICAESYWLKVCGQVINRMVQTERHNNKMRHAEMYTISCQLFYDRHVSFFTSFYPFFARTSLI
jgi:hypothetical protein